MFENSNNKKVMTKKFTIFTKNKNNQIKITKYFKLKNEANITSHSKVLFHYVGITILPSNMKL
jgi:hypothetical protein